MQDVNVVGAGLAGCEASYQLLIRGYKVNLYEMKPKKFSPAHKNPNFAELVCSNSLKSEEINTSSGLLKSELSKLGSLLISVAKKTKVPAGGALAVDREEFSKSVTEELKNFDNLNIINEEFTKIDITKPTIIATGPLTSEALCNELKNLLGDEYLYFFDAIAPIVNFNSINFDIAYFADRYGKGNGDYINLPMNKEEYLKFYNELINAETVKLKDFENTKVFEGCMPVEVMAKRGIDTLRYGMLKPVGLINPRTNKEDYAVVQLRRETNNNDLFNIVGFQTNLTYPEQKRVFRLIPGLENAEFYRYGVMHRNTFINAPKNINKFYQLKKYPNIFVAGQLSGVEGYIESISSGLMCGINMANYLENKPLIHFSNKTIIGALSEYISTANENNFQPMNSNFGIVAKINEKFKNKKDKNTKIAELSLKTIDEILKK